MLFFKKASATIVSGVVLFCAMFATSMTVVADTGAPSGDVAERMAETFRQHVTTDLMFNAEEVKKTEKTMLDENGGDIRKICSKAVVADTFAETEDVGRYELNMGSYYYAMDDAQSWQVRYNPGSQNGIEYTGASYAIYSDDGNARIDVVFADNHYEVCVAANQQTDRFFLMDEDFRHPEQASVSYMLTGPSARGCDIESPVDIAMWGTLATALPDIIDAYYTTCSLGEPPLPPSEGFDPEEVAQNFANHIVSEFEGAYNAGCGKIDYLIDGGQDFRTITAACLIGEDYDILADGEGRTAMRNPGTGDWSVFVTEGQYNNFGYLSPAVVDCKWEKDGFSYEVSITPVGDCYSIMATVCSPEYGRISSTISSVIKFAKVENSCTEYYAVRGASTGYIDSNALALMMIGAECAADYVNT